MERIVKTSHFTSFVRFTACAAFIPVYFYFEINEFLFTAITISLLVVILSTFFFSSKKKNFPLSLYGDVGKVIVGKVEKTDLREIKKFFFGLGCGTFEKMDNIGEVLFLNGQCYIKGCYESNNYAVESGNKIYSPFCFGLKKYTEPSYKRVIRKEISVQNLYAEILEKLDFFAIVGIAEMDDVFTTVIKTAPIYGEALMENREKYYHPVKNLGKKMGVFFGVVVKNDLIKYGKLKKIVQRMFYVNFADAKSKATFQSHSHIVFYDEKKMTDLVKMNSSFGKMIEDVGKKEVEDVHHLLTQSKIKKNSVFYIFPVKDIVVE